ncbi:MAG TPA: geranylgeranylglycerol-phosphate geranylgeranyltransferase [Chitinophagaceae bacterium]|nr:geranylgeranylglycerol-phosphate geranylgeranyltransferase [Chitinophagaceae bacterium]
MQKIKAAITLIRLPNLAFIFLTQIVAWFALIVPYLKSDHVSIILSNGYIYWLAFSTVFIAAAGYMINDYFDIGIDSINKPERVTIEKIFKRRSIIIWHIVLNLLALCMAGYLCAHFLLFRYLIFQLISIFLLVVYSTTFKRKLIIGNLIISLLTSLTLISLAMYELHYPLYNFSDRSIQLYWLYILFAFLITASREVIKDIEDIKGDGIQQCKTIPLVWGINTAKYIVYGLIIILLLLLIIASILFMSTEMMLVCSWILFLFVPLIFILYKIHHATNAIHFHQISFYIKIITLAGILSMLINLF